MKTLPIAQPLKITIIAVSIFWPNCLTAETLSLDEISFTDIVTQTIQFLTIPLVFFILFNKKLRAHFLWNRIIGKSVEITDKKIKKELQNQINLENFTSAYPRLRIDNIYEARAIIDFCKQEKIDISELSGIPIKITYDENKSPEVSLPNTYGIFDQISTGLLFLCAIAIFLLGALAPSLTGFFGGYLFKMKETHEYIWLSDKQYAKKIFVESIKKLTIDDCKKGDSDHKKYNMTKNELSSMCNVLKGNKEDDQTLLDIKEKGIWLSSILCSASLFSIYIFLMQLIKINKTIKLLKKIASKRISSNNNSHPDNQLS